MKPFRDWTVLPHGKLMRVDEDILCVTGDIAMPLGHVPRRMTIVRLDGGELVVFSAIALGEREMATIESFGIPRYLVVPSDIHRMDAKTWKDRYPNMIVIAPAGARDRVEKIVHVDRVSMRFDERVELVTVPGTGKREAALVVQTRTGTTLVVNDLIFNLRDMRGLSGWLFKLMNITGKRPSVTRVVKMHSIRDKATVARQLAAWAKLDRLERIIMAHGDIVTRSPRAVLKRLAHELAA